MPSYSTDIRIPSVMDIKHKKISCWPTGNLLCFSVEICNLLSTRNKNALRLCIYCFLATFFHLMVYTNITGHSSWCLIYREGLRDIGMIHLKILNSENILPLGAWSLNVSHFATWASLSQKETLEAAQNVLFRLKVIQENQIKSNTRESPL